MDSVLKRSVPVWISLWMALGGSACSSEGSGAEGGGAPDVVSGADADGAAGFPDASTGPDADIFQPISDGASDGASDDAAGDADTWRCRTDDDCQAPTAHCSATGACVQCTASSHCEQGQSCAEGECFQGACVPDKAVCDGSTLRICNEAGTGFTEIDCAPGTCIAGACQGCTPGQKQCQGAKLLECDSESLTYVEVQDCAEAKLCSAEAGACLECFPLQAKCVDDNVWTCAADGSGFAFTQNCGGEGTCVLGKCLSSCSSNLKLNTNVGCDYWGVDLDNFNDPDADLTAADAPYAIVVSNVSDKPAQVTVSAGFDPLLDTTATVAPGELHIFPLPPRNVDGTMKGAFAWRVQSTEPIVAYQFNPLENVGVYSNDASVLFPSNAWGTDYMVMTWRQYGPASTTPPTINGFVTVVAGFANTEVTIVPSGATQAGGDIPALSAGQAYTTTLGPFEILNIESAGNGVDLTGTVVTSSKPVGVFGGHECARTSDDACCCDHLEQQMIPTSAWGKTYVAVSSSRRNAEFDHWRILAKEDGTTVTTNPSLTGSAIQLNKGQVYDLDAQVSFVVEATKPVMVGQFLASSHEIAGTCETGCAAGATCIIFTGECQFFTLFCSGQGQGTCPDGHACQDNDCEPIGDPAFVLMPPVEQFLSEYQFLTPNNYVFDYLGVVAPVGTTIELDGNQTIALEPVSPSSSWAAATIAVSDGIHSIKSPDKTKFGIVVHGFDDDVSYGYTGGLALENLDLP